MKTALPESVMHRRGGRAALGAAISAAAMLALAGVSAAQDKKEEKKKDPPRVVMALPPAVSPGMTVKVKLRGTGLDQATAVQFADSKAVSKVEIKSKGKSEVPKGFEAPRAGDSQVEIELTLAADALADAPTGVLPIVLVTPEGVSPAHELTMLAADSLAVEKESNGGFRNAQEISAGKTLMGTIGEEKDVDVYRITARAGQTLVAQVRAARHGSTLDAVLTLHDARGHVLATVDDSESTSDPALTFKLPADGVYYLALIDSLDRGGATYTYLLSAQIE